MSGLEMPKNQRFMVKTDDGWVPLPDPEQIAQAIEALYVDNPEMSGDYSWNTAIREAAAVARRFKP